MDLNFENIFLVKESIKVAIINHPNQIQGCKMAKPAKY